MFLSVFYLAAFCFVFVFFPCFKEDEIVVHVISNIWLRFFASHTHTHAHRHTQTHAHTHTVFWFLSVAEQYVDQRGATQEQGKKFRKLHRGLLWQSQTHSIIHTVHSWLSEMHLSLYIILQLPSLPHITSTCTMKENHLKKNIYIQGDLQLPSKWFWPLYIYCWN